MTSVLTRDTQMKRPREKEAMWKEADTGSMKPQAQGCLQLQSYDKPRQHIKKQRHHFADKGLYSQSYDFSSSLYGCESWTIKKGLRAKESMLSNCGAGEDTWESLGKQGDQPINPKGSQSWIFTGRAGAEAEAPVLWPPDVKSRFIGKDPDARKDWKQEEKGTTEDEMAGWHHWLSGHEFEQVPGVGDGQGGLACCSLWGHKEQTLLSNRTTWGWKRQRTESLIEPLHKYGFNFRVLLPELWEDEFTLLSVT